MSKIIARGAEAIIELNQGRVIKKRIAKGYRYLQLDEKIRKLRTRAESRLLEKAATHINVPRVIQANEQTKELVLEFIKGKKLADCLEDHTSKAKQIGQTLAKLHKANLIHGDLTTSNMILQDSKIYLIDFGLGFQSSRVEDKAVDLHVLKEALEARHPKVWEKVWESIKTNYKFQDSKRVLKQLEKVESRGRYKAQY